ncbi:hypothetical protein ZOSMA_219G00020, partial [Zostera marina]|jgi:hypothetical protein
MAVA